MWCCRRSCGFSNHPYCIDTESLYCLWCRLSTFCRLTERKHKLLPICWRSHTFYRIANRIIHTMHCSVVTEQWIAPCGTPLVVIGVRNGVCICKDAYISTFKRLCRCRFRSFFFLRSFSSISPLLIDSMKYNRLINFEKCCFLNCSHKFFLRLI